MAPSINGVLPYVNLQRNEKILRFRESFPIFGMLVKVYYFCRMLDAPHHSSSKLGSGFGFHNSCGMLDAVRASLQTSLHDAAQLSLVRVELEEYAWCEVCWQHCENT